MANNKVGLNTAPQYSVPVIQLQDKGWAFLLKQPIQDEVSFSSKQNTEANFFKAFMTYVAEAVRKFCIMSAYENYMDSYINKDFIQNSLNEHYDEISELLGKYGYKPEIHMQHLMDSRNHFITTYNLAKNLTSDGDYDISEDEREILLEAALLHDIGKCLIPDEIFNKPDAFTAKEREVMDLHSELGYILLKDSGIRNATLNAIRNHHHKEQTGDKITEILSMCDVTSALKENRVYKKGLSDEKTANILKQDANAGKLNTEVIETGLNIMSFEPKEKPQPQGG